MLRTFLLLGFVAGAFAAFPVIYQHNPQPIAAMLLRMFHSAHQEAAGAPSVSAPQPARAEAPPIGRTIAVPSDAHGHYVAEFRLNGRRVSALIDTGATFVAINASLARRIGLKLSQSDFRHKIGTANGQTEAAAVTIDMVEIGRIRLEDVQAVVLNDKALGEALVGLSFLNRLSRFHMESGMLVLEQ